MSTDLKYNNLIIYAVVFFFFNSFLLPHGLLYTTILTPLMIYFLFKERKIKLLLIFSFGLVIPVPFQLINGVDAGSYAISNIMIFTVLVFLITVYAIAKKNNDILDSIFRKILIINSLFVMISVIILPMPAIRNLLWYDEVITKGLELIPRLKLFTYEASYYSLVMMPVFLYFILRVLYNEEKHALLVSLAVIIPLLLSLSFGVIGALALALIMVCILYWKKTPVSLQRTLLIGSISLISFVIILIVVWPDNPVFYRIQNIYEGEDTSAMGRLIYSFMFAWDLILQNNLFFGIGAGQVKIVAHDMIINHYKYHGSLAEIVRIPNSMAEMLAIYGIYGFVLKLVLEIYFFVKFKIYNNLFSVTLFVFIFIYQFTGSFITNVAEIAIWALIFGARFKEFEISKQTETI